MLFVHLTLRVASRGAGENLIIRGIGMTIGTLIPFVAMFPGINGEILLIVIEIGSPIKGSMAEFTSCRIPLRQVIGISSSIIIPLMTEETGCGCSGKLPADMAIIAIGRDMRSGEGEGSAVMIESRRRPGAGGMALGANGRGPGVHSVDMT